VLFLIFVLLTVAGAAGVYLTVPKPYQATSLLVLLSSDTTVDGNGHTTVVNPWNDAGSNSAQVVASALATVAASDRFLNTLATKGVQSSTSVQVSTGGGGVLLEVATVDKTATVAAQDLATVTEALQTELADRQKAAGAPANSFLHLASLTGQSLPAPQGGSRLKLSGVAVVLGLLVTMIVVAAVDSRARRRAEKAPRSTTSAGTQPSVYSAGTIIRQSDVRAVAGQRRRGSKDARRSGRVREPADQSDDVIATG
jgi:hypothetical protein